MSKPLAVPESSGMAAEASPHPKPRLPWRKPAGKAQPAARPKQNLLARLRDWHKRAGLFAFVFMGWLGATGILLNSSVTLGLDAKRLDWGWLMGMYGLHAQAPETGFDAAGHWLATTNEYSVLDGRPLAQQIPHPLGFAVGGTESAPLLFIATTDRLVLLTPDGERVDELSGYTLPVDAIRRIGVVEATGAVAIQDLDIYVTQDGLGWDELAAGTKVRWSQPQALSSELKAKTLPFARPSMPIEQILIDVHSGRLFGRFGVYVINLVGLAALALSITGIWMWYRINQSRKKRKTA